MTDLDNATIGIFAPMNLNRFAGDTARIVEIIRGLRSRGFDVTPIIPFSRDSKNITTLLEPYESFKVPLPNNASLKFALLTIFTQYLTRSQISPEKFDILQIEWPFALPLSRFRQIASQDNVIFDMHSVAAFDLAPFIPSPLRLPIVNALLSSQDYLCRKSECLVVSHRMKQFMIDRLELNPKRIHIITNGVNVKAAHSAISNLSHRYDHLREEAEPLLVYVGGLEWYEGVDLIIRAVAELRETLPRVRLVIAGRGSDEDHLRILVSDLNLKNYVMFLGWIPYEDTFALQSVADVLVAPRKPLGTNDFDITCPLKIPAYLTAGKPILSSSIGEIPHIVRHNQEALLVEELTPECYSNEIVQLWNDSSLMKRMSDNCVKRAAEFDWSVIVGRLLDVYSRILTAK